MVGIGTTLADTRGNGLRFGRSAGCFVPPGNPGFATGSGPFSPVPTDLSTEGRVGDTSGIGPVVRHRTCSPVPFLALRSSSTRKVGPIAEVGHASSDRRSGSTRTCGKVAARPRGARRDMHRPGRARVGRGQRSSPWQDSPRSFLAATVRDVAGLGTGHPVCSRTCAVEKVAPRGIAAWCRPCPISTSGAYPCSPSCSSVESGPNPDRSRGLLVARPAARAQPQPRSGASRPPRFRRPSKRPEMVP